MVGSEVKRVKSADNEQKVEEVKLKLSRSNSWFAQVKQREAKLQAAEDKALERQESKDSKSGRRSSFFGNTLRRLSSNTSRESRDSVSSYSGSIADVPQNDRVTLNKNPKRKRPSVPELRGTNLRRVCFQLDELVELRTYEQVEADLPSDAEEDDSIPTVKDMKIINPYASSTPLDRADLYLQCCKVYRIEPHAQIVKQFRARGPKSATYEGPRTLELRDLDMSFQDAVALADCLGLPLTGKHLTEVIFDNCGLNDESLQLLLSCLFGSAKLESLDVLNNTRLTHEGVKHLIGFLCLSPQLQRFAWRGPQLDSAGVRLLTDVLRHLKVKGLTELGIAGAKITDAELDALTDVAQKLGIHGYDFSEIAISTKGLDTIASQLSGSGSLYFVCLSRNDLSSSLHRFIDALNKTSQLISLELQECNLSAKNVESLLSKLTILPNFRRLDLSKQDLRSSLPALRTILPKMHLVRRLVLGNCGFTSSDVVALCEVIATMTISQLVLTGVELDASAMSALYAVARVSKALVSVEIDIPDDAYSEKIGRRILAECIKNMETSDTSRDPADSEVHANVVQEHKRLSLKRQETNKHEELHHGANGVAQALDFLLDSSKEETAKDLPRAMYERAKYMKQKLEPALAEPLDDEMQRRRLMLVTDTLTKVIERYEKKYPDEFDSTEMLQTPSPHGTDTYEHSGRPKAHPDYPPRRGNTGIKSRQLETEEGEIMKLAHRMTDRLNILKSASTSPSQSTSRQELADSEEANMLRQIDSTDVDGAELKQRLYKLQDSDMHRQRPQLGAEIH